MSLKDLIDAVDSSEGSDEVWNTITGELIWSRGYRKIPDDIGINYDIIFGIMGRYNRDDRTKEEIIRELEDRKKEWIIAKK